MVISWKLFWSALGAVVAFASAGLMSLLSVSWLIAVPLAGAAVWGMWAGTRMVVHRTEVFANLRETARHSIVRWVTAAAAVYAVWLVLFTIRPLLWPAWLIVLAAITVLTYWVARLHEYLLTQVKPSPAVGDASARDLDDTEKIFRTALRKVQLDWLVILPGWEAVRGALDEKPFGVKFQVKKPAESNATLGIEHADRIANALGEVFREGGANVDLESDWVAIQKERTAGTYSVTVVTEDVMGRIYPYRDTLAPASIYEPAEIGTQLDGSRYHIQLRQHGQVVGQSTYGKSAFISTLIAYILRCPDAVLWIAGVEKLYDLVAGWIECYMDTGIRIPIDWIANGQQDVVRMLVGGMAGARWRQKQPMSKRGWPTVITILDEASFALENRTVRYPYQGVKCTASDIAAMQARGSASGDFFEILASQRDTMDDFGDKGAVVNANMGWVAGFRTRDQNGLGRLLNDYKVPMPRHRGELWLEAGEGALPAHIKGDYIQSIDPTKPRLHSGATVTDVAWARRTIEHRLDNGTAAAVDEATEGAYSRRHTHMDQELLAYLTQAVDLEDTASGTEEAAYDIASAHIKALLDGPQPSTDPVDVSGVATMSGRKPLHLRCVEIVRDIGGQVSRDQIVNALRDAGEKPGEQVLTNALTKTVKDGLMARPDGQTGVYTAH